MKCEYCGNTSGFRDGRGHCISCGAPLPELLTFEIQKEDTFDQIIDNMETSLAYRYNMSSGSSLLIDTDIQNYFNKYVTNPIKEFLRT